MTYHLAQPEQLFGMFSAEISPAEARDTKFLVWTVGSTTRDSTKLPIGSAVEVEATLKKPMLGRLVGDRAEIRIVDGAF